jgi:ribonuclease VapC
VSVSLEPASSRGTAAVPVLDASALLAYLLGEAGGDVVAEAMSDGAAIATVNLAEVLSTLATRGQDPEEAVALLENRRILGGAIRVEPLTQEDAIEVARLRPLTKSAGLSLGDRACIALAKRLGASAVTAEPLWLQVPTGVDVVLIRERSG